MRLTRYNTRIDSPTTARLGVVFDMLVGDLRAAAERLLADRGEAQARQLAELRVPLHLVDLLAAGPEAMALVEEAAAWLRGLAATDREACGIRGERLLIGLDEARLHAPVRPSKMIAVGRNYAEHLKEVGLDLPHRVPSAWIKANSTIIGPHRDVVKPACTQKLDYENELAIVIGRKCKNVPRERAYEVIFGYTIVNDVSARDIARIERKEGNQLLGKMFDTFAPQGPWVVTRDEIADPMNLTITTRVNGELRQSGSTAGMIWPIPDLIAYLSQMTLEPGDLILTGTPAGCANGRDPALPSWFLEPGDVIESEIEQIGMLRNRIVAAPAGQESWTW